MKKLMVLLPDGDTIVIKDLDRIWVELDWGRSIFFSKPKYVLCYEDAKYERYVALISMNKEYLKNIGSIITRAYNENKEFIDLYKK